MTASAKKADIVLPVLPTTKWETWKYTSLKPVENALAQPSDLTKARAYAAKDVPVLPQAFDDIAGKLVIVDGLYRADLSVLPTECMLSVPHTPESEEARPLLQVNAVFGDSGVAVTIPAKKRLENPLMIQHISTGSTTAYPRIDVRAEEGSEAVLVEIWQGTGAGVNNTAVNVHVAKNATLHHYRWQNESFDATHLTMATITVDRDASYDSFVLTTGAKLARQDSIAHMIGENAECRLNGVYLLAGTQHNDTTILVHHKQPHGRSNQTFKGIIDDRAHAVFQGKVFVHRSAQKTDGYQLNNALLLSNTAQVDVKPELEIYADDVKCSHGATTGQIDTAPLFYLRTRGLSEAQARLLLMQAFVGPALDEIRSEAVREIFLEMTLNWLQNHTG